MRVAAEKLRQLSARLKSAGNALGRTARSNLQDAKTGLQRAKSWPGERWAARKGGMPAGESLWGDSPPLAVPASAETAMPASSPVTGWRARYPGLAKGLRWALIAIAVYLAAPYPLILIYRFVDPPISALMLRNALLGRGVDQQWVDFADISPNLPTAAIIAEDAAFCRHWGVDWTAVSEALEDLVEDGDTPRGASTIPMQTAKNLFLWPGQDYFRKALEVPLAYFMSLVWPKQRLIEIYLNIAEWGPGIYGAEAAARYHFGKPASALTASESALLVSALPSPLKRNAGRPSARMQRLASRIQGRVSREAPDAACVFDR
ncbi:MULTISPECIES: monofunctional biosynthetic peptidoglycan transglycosylase [Rhodomicrobium]|uniref:monofunctional biosynthetic peptidoglycan transglycosylase n=1 Tax=Rhodomicrobium TaxID=1068 RepID=UPI001FD9AACA|nr:MULTISPECIES: monofunctional biosynthetic peptidoglycan transglycosylase [Rhodomicrobium]